MTERNENWQGMNWIRQEKRLAIYLRDGCACAYCGATMEGGNKLSLDHVVCVSKRGANNDESNLVTACMTCNTSRGKRSVKKFCEAVAKYVNHGVQADEILRHVRNCQRRVLKPYVTEAKQLIALRGSVQQVLNGRG